MNNTGASSGILYSSGSQIRSSLYRMIFLVFIFISFINTQILGIYFVLSGKDYMPCCRHAVMVKADKAWPLPCWQCRKEDRELKAMTTKIVLIKIKAILGTMSTMTSLVYWPMAPYDHMRKKTGKWEVALADISPKSPTLGCPRSA